MKIKDYKCKCGHDDFFFADKGSQKGIYCSYCGKWYKWADHDEQNLAMRDNIISIPHGASYADVIKAVFGEGEEQVVYSGLGSRRCIEFEPDSVKNTKDAYGFHTMGMIFAEDLWNAPYNGGLISEEY